MTVTVPVPSRRHRLGHLTTMIGSTLTQLMKLLKICNIHGDAGRFQLSASIDTTSSSSRVERSTMSSASNCSCQKIRFQCHKHDTNAPARTHQRLCLTLRLETLKIPQSIGWCPRKALQTVLVAVDETVDCWSLRWETRPEKLLEERRPSEEK